MNLKKHSFALITGFLFLAAAGGVGFLLLASRGKFVDAKSNLDAAEAKFKQLSDGTPYPSDENVEIVRENLVKMQGFHAELESLLCAGQIQPQPMERAEFPERLEKMYESLRGVATNRSVRLPAEFYFGFQAYVDNLPAEEDVPRLTVQAQVVEQVCGLLFSNKISTLESIERQSFEKGLTAGDSRGGFRGRGMDGFGFGDEIMAEDEPVLEEENGLYTTEHVDVLFTARDEHVWNLLNALGSSDLFVTVTRVEIESTGSGSESGSMMSGRTGMSRRGGIREFEGFGGEFDGFGNRGAYTPRSQNEGFGRGATRTPDGDGAAPVILPHEDRVVAGREERATVQLGLDVYRFCLAPEVEEGLDDEDLFGDEADVSSEEEDSEGMNL